MSGIKITGTSSSAGKAPRNRNGLAPGFTIGTDAHGNPIFLYQGQPVSQSQIDQMNTQALGGAPSTAPPGTYDPALDAQLQNANTGFGYTAQDFDTANLRNKQDYQTALAQLAQTHGYTLADLLSANQRANQDFGTQTGYLNADYATGTQRNQQDYGTQTAALGRQYTNLGASQAGAIRAAGEAEGGALAQSLAKRQANQAIDQAGIDTGYQRQTQDLNTSHDRGLASLLTDQTRTNQDYGTNVGRENTGYGQQTDQLGQTYQRTADDSLLNYARAGAQNTMFGQQVNAEKVYSAQQNSMLPDPSNIEVHNGVQYRRNANGKLVRLY